MTKIPGYQPLRDALNDAIKQAAEGKGAERHADSKPFVKQPIMQTTDAVGIGFPMGQAMKKLGEAAGMIKRNREDQAQAELLGAIVYIAAAYIKLKETRNDKR